MENPNDTSGYSGNSGDTTDFEKMSLVDCIKFFNGKSEEERREICDTALYPTSRTNLAGLMSTIIPYGGFGLSIGEIYGDTLSNIVGDLNSNTDECPRMGKSGHRSCLPFNHHPECELVNYLTKQALEPHGRSNLFFGFLDTQHPEVTEATEPDGFKEIMANSMSDETKARTTVNAKEWWKLLEGNDDSSFSQMIEQLRSLNQEQLRFIEGSFRSLDEHPRQNPRLALVKASIAHNDLSSGLKDDGKHEKAVLEVLFSFSNENNQGVSDGHFFAEQVRKAVESFDCKSCVEVFTGKVSS